MPLPADRGIYQEKGVESKKQKVTHRNEHKELVDKYFSNVGIQGTQGGNITRMELCGSLNENSPYTLMLGWMVHSGTVWEGLGGVTLLE